MTVEMDESDRGRAYWRSRTPQERLVEMERLRRDYCERMGIDPNGRLERVLNILVLSSDGEEKIVFPPSRE